jgi:hypothetical protein
MPMPADEELRPHWLTEAPTQAPNRLMNLVQTCPWLAPHLFEKDAARRELTRSRSKICRKVEEKRGDGDVLAFPAEAPCREIYNQGTGGDSSASPELSVAHEARNLESQLFRFQ